jgi:hypothetical protein
MIELGLAELEYELWEEQALKAFLASRNVSAAELEADPNMVMEFDAYLMEAEGNPELQASTDEAAGRGPKKNSEQA